MEGQREVPTRTNGVTSWTLSRAETRRNCSTCEDTGYPRQDGKTPWSLTVRPTSRAGTKVGHSDPTARCGMAVAQRIKVTPGITGLSGPRVHIDGPVWHLDVGSSHPGAGVGPKGWAVRPLKRYASWV